MDNQIIQQLEQEAEEESLDNSRFGFAIYVIPFLTIGLGSILWVWYTLQTWNPLDQLLGYFFTAFGLLLVILSYFLKPKKIKYILPKGGNCRSL